MGGTCGLRGATTRLAVSFHLSLAPCPPPGISPSRFSSFTNSQRLWPHDSLAYMKNDAIAILVDLGLGTGKAVVWTCDLTKVYA
jgi:hypothetical protein